MGVITVKMFIIRTEIRVRFQVVTTKAGLLQRRNGYKKLSRPEVVLNFFVLKIQYLPLLKRFTCACDYKKVHCGFINTTCICTITAFNS